jgi:beta-glucan synthesis-associated protein KRE6
MREGVTFSFLFLLLVKVSRAGWVDPATHGDSHRVISDVDGRVYKLVFSDEFNTDGRGFSDGSDPRWTAINKDDYTNFALHYYNENLVKTSNGFLNITTEVRDITFAYDDVSAHSTRQASQPQKKTKNYQSGMVQGWNKFCFTGGIVEISAKLPGNAYVGGLWPAMWLLGNLARATYVGSSNNIW